MLLGIGNVKPNTQFWGGRHGRGKGQFGAAHPAGGLTSLGHVLDEGGPVNGFRKRKAYTLIVHRTLRDVKAVVVGAIGWGSVKLFTQYWIRCDFIMLRQR